MQITMKKLTSPLEFQQMEQLEAAVWSEKSVIPLHMTLTLAKFGGLFLGAFDEEEMIGFLYSFPGHLEGEPLLCSHMLGFLPAYRKQGLGVKMKWFQREEALRLGYQKISWTYDPLETVNATVNIAKLGGMVRRYVPNCYGELHDEMNKGLPTDRFIVEWLLDSERVRQYSSTLNKQPAASRSFPKVLSWKQDEQGLPVPLEPVWETDEPFIGISVPAYFQQIKRTDMNTAKEWRQVTRQLFPHYFSNGYTVVDVIRQADELTVTYLLQKGVDWG
ncbi:GNAT family N-acetyltransferase [Brevibacillus humidisoli]|uniref:GNAT family N-acetyltransferase n=1 Tax=Brevibacillus humidisoli TaxID=2895522 RepID=UPI001E395C90|nr:GNAT family N-acetyltransferase [Brevibacillus humidisoli]UFJ41573.1 GNAT family N-acetyltransferase [Brevibacillus humidisoli]